MRSHMYRLRRDSGVAAEHRVDEQRMNTRAIAFFCSLGLLGPLGCAAQAVVGPPLNPGRHVIHHYSVELPAGYTMQHVWPKMDFDLYVVIARDDEMRKCTLYFGNFPSFPKFQWSGEPTVTSANGWTRKEFRSLEKIEGLVSASGLTYRGSFTPFSRVHYYCHDLRPGEVSTFSAMMDSLRIAKPVIQ